MNPRRTLLIFFMISFVALIGGPNEISEELPLVWQEGDDELVEVTVGQLREALWFREMYFVEKKLSEARGEIIADYEDRVSDILGEVKRLRMADAFLGETTRYLKMVGVAAIVVLTVQTLGEIISWSR